MYRVSDTVLSTHNHDGAIIVDIQHDRLLRLNRTGSDIFQRVATAQTQLQIVEALSRDFHICRQSAQRDVENFLRSLEEQGLIQRIRSEEA
jgi:DNA-binding MarR family transcriptional regulator